ncbi:MAG: hypothetical protein ACRCY9_15810, partial [Phycicoccus sp.]
HDETAHPSAIRPTRRSSTRGGDALDDGGGRHDDRRSGRISGTLCAGSGNDPDVRGERGGARRARLGAVRG